MFLTCGTLFIVVAFCAICVSANILSLGIFQQVAEPAAVNITPVIQVQPASSDEVDSLLSQVNALLGELEIVETEANAANFSPPVAVTPPSAKPALIAFEKGIYLYTGPGANFKKVTTLPPGQSFDIVGRTPDTNWWLVALPNGNFAWVAAALVSAINVTPDIPVVTIPALLDQQPTTAAAFAPGVAAATPTATAIPTVTPTPTLPPGTPTPSIDEHRVAVFDTIGYQAIIKSMMTPPISMSYSPDGKQIALTERIKVYTMPAAGGAARVWLEEDDKMGPIGGLVWSPDGTKIAQVIGFKHKYCRPCRAVAILNVEDETMFFLTPPEEHLETDMPRWTQGGRLLVNVHPGEPADGVAYEYDEFGQNPQPARGTYILSSSHEGQKWYPWLPGRTWRAGVSERADSYNAD